MNALLIYQEIPEKVSFYFIESPTEEQITVLETACNKFTNLNATNEQQTALDKIGEAIQSNPEYYANVEDYGYSYPEWQGIWASSKMDLPALLPSDVYVFTCGFVM